MKKRRSSGTVINFESILKDSQIFKNLFESAPDIIWIHDFEGNILSCNDMAIQMTGYCRKELQSMNLRDIVHPNIDIDSKIKSLVENKEITYESVHRRKDGSEYPVEVHARLISLQGQSMAVSFARVITDRKQTEEALRESEEIFRRFMEYSPVYVFFKDKNTRALRLSKNYEKMLGKPVEELLGKNMYDLFPSELAKSMVADDMRILKEGKDITVEEEFNGRFYSTMKFPIFIDGKPRYLAGYTIDITERKKAEESLKESEQRFREMAELLPNTLFESDLNGMITYVNRTGFDKFGYLQKDIVDGLNMFKLLIPEDREKAKEQIGRRLNGEKSGGNEYTALTKDGKTFSVIITTNLMLKDGKPIGFRGVVTDITEQKKVEESLHKTEKHLHSVITAAPIALWDLNSAGNITLSEGKALTQLGVRAGERVGRSVFELYKDAPEALAFIQRGLAGEEFIAETKVRDMHWSNHYVPRRDEKGNVCGLVGVSIDITERKRAEDALSDSEEKFRNFMETANEFMYITDEKMNLTYMNGAMVRNLGYSKEELLRMNVTHLLTREEIEKGFNPRYQELVTIGRLAIEDTWITKDKKEIRGEISAVAVYDNDHNFIGARAVFHDITERKQMEKALIESERLSAIGELASGVAHDFNNSLQAIFGNIELALLERDVPAVVSRYLTTIKTSASDAAVRVQQLQCFAGKRGTKGEYTAVSLNTVLNDAIEQAKPKWKAEAEKKGLIISIQNNYGEIKPVDGNPGELRSAFYNLIKNAVEAMPEGGTVSFETGSTDKSVYVRITDTGIGMDEETKKRIFQPFFTTKGLEPGRGLGMSAVYTTIKDHNGEVYVKESTPGKGTTIEVALPYGEKKIENPLETTIGEYQGVARVLWVDDEEMIRDVGQQQLEMLGHKADVASSGAEALKLLETNHYDLIITDIGMPNMSGWQLAEQIKNRYKGIKVAIITGWGADVTDEEKEKYGVGYVLGKPVSLVKIEKLVGEVIQLQHK